MLISFVTGTYNRLPVLQRMVESVRQQMPRHLPYEFVIVDGGSTDGTLEWLDQQPDIRTIRHGRLLGAIPAFCDGAKASRGEYVLMGNDDIIFQDGSILRAISYLEEHRNCGAVAFADNRSIQAGITQEAYRVEQMPATNPDGEPIAVNYAQVGLFRRWLADLAGWWGADDKIMQKARTYGGDNYLSARLWELGYSVDAVPGCFINDQIHKDDLRVHNAQNGHVDSQQYYARFPRGPQVFPYPRVRNEQVERLRILLLDIHESRLPARTAKEYGLADALAKVGLTWQIDYANEEYDLPSAVRAWQPHILITQMHDIGKINAGVLSAAKAEKPDLVIVNWNGDAHERGLTSPEILEALRYVDLQTVVNAKVLPFYEREGIRAAYWQIGWKPEAAPFEGEVQAHDVLVQMNCYNEERKRLVRRLQEIHGIDLGVYGGCEGTQGSTHYDFALQAALNRAATIVVGDTFPNTEAFVSNRVFQVLGAGGFLLQQHSKNLDRYTGLIAGEHYVEWTDLDDLEEKIEHWLKPEQAEERARIAECGMAFVRQHFNYDAQVKKLWGLLP